MQRSACVTAKQQPREPRNRQHEVRAFCGNVADSSGEPNLLRAHTTVKRRLSNEETAWPHTRGSIESRNSAKSWRPWRKFFWGGADLCFVYTKKVWRRTVALSNSARMSAMDMLSCEGHPDPLTPVTAACGGGSTPPSRVRTRSASTTKSLRRELSAHKGSGRTVDVVQEPRRRDVAQSHSARQVSLEILFLL